MNGYKILKCFRKEKRVSGELPSPVTGLIMLNFYNVSFCEAFDGFDSCLA